MSANKNNNLANLRNFGVSSHVDAGKTSTTERILFYTGRIHKMGEVHEGQATMDSMDQEQERGITIQSAATRCEWQGHPMNLIDTPGHVDFASEVARALRVLDGAIILLDAEAGVEPQSEAVWNIADQNKVPRVVFMNKMDKLGADFDNAIQTMRDRLQCNPVRVQIPIGVEDSFRGVVDLVEMKSLVWDKDEMGIEWTEGSIPEDLLEAAEEAREEMLDAVSEHDDELLHAYLEGEEVSAEMIRRAIRAATISLAIQPVFCGSALKNTAVQPILDAVVHYLPSPLDLPKIHGFNKDGEEVEREQSADAPFSALAFKLQRDKHMGKLVYLRVYSGKAQTGGTFLNTSTGKTERIGRLMVMHADSREEVERAEAGQIVAAVGLKNVSTGDTLTAPDDPITLEEIQFEEAVVHVAVEPATKSEQEKFATSLASIVEEDPTLHLSTDEETGQTILSGVGELQLDVNLERLRREYGVEARMGEPQVAYREAIKARAEKVEGRVKKQTGGRGQFGHCVINIEPLKDSAEEFEFDNQIKGGSIPKEFISPVEQGIRDAMYSGVIAGYPLVGVKAELVDGSTHPVDASEVAYRIAGSKALRAAVKKASPTILEPIMRVEVSTPEEFLGTVIGDLSSRRGQVQSQESRGSVLQVTAHVPLAELFGYAGDLRSNTQGRAQPNMRFEKYAEAPSSVVEELREQAHLPRDEDDE